MPDGRSRGPWLIFAGLIGVLLVAAGLAWWMLPWGQGSGADLLPVAPPEAEPPTAASEPSEPVQAPRTSRIPIPRPAPVDVDADSDPVVDSDLGTEEVDSDFPRVIAEGAEIRDALQAALQPQLPAMVECLGGWEEEQPGVFEGRAVFVFVMDRDGVVDLAVDEVESVPPGVLGCLGDVLWEDVEWPGIEGDAPTEVTWPIQVSIDPDAEED